MKHAPIGVVVVLCAQLAGSSGGQVPKVAVKDIKKHVGREVTACGRVVTDDCENASGSLVLDLDSPWTTRDGVSVELPRKHWPDNLGRGLSNQYSMVPVVEAIGRFDAMYQRPPRDSRNSSHTSCPTCHARGWAVIRSFDTRAVKTRAAAFSATPVEKIGRWAYVHQ